MEDTGYLFISVDLAECGKLYRESIECYNKTDNKKKQIECLKIYKNYQFCLAKAESEKLEQQKHWETFKEKWGHYPGQIEENPPA